MLLTIPLVTMRAGVFLRGASLLLIGVVINLAVVLPLPDVMSSIVGALAALLFALGLAWIGAALLADRGQNRFRLW
jgi:hypothetical protein